MRHIVSLALDTCICAIVKNMLSQLPKNPFAHGNDLLLDIKVTPRAKENKVIGWQEYYLVVRIAEIAEKGKANEALIQTIAQEFSLKKSQVEIVAGKTSRIKRVRLRTCTEDHIRKHI